MRVLYVYNINSIVDNLTKQNLMYSLVVSYKVKLHMHVLHIFMIICIINIMIVINIIFLYTVNVK